METVLIKGATFTMGTPIRNEKNPKYHDDEAPLEVTVADFRIGKYPVTAEQMCLFLNSPTAKKHDRESLYFHHDIGLSRDDSYSYSTITMTGDGQYVPRDSAAKAPANQVTWKGAALFCKWLSAETGKQYRLPTEAEWELAARGKELRRWPWGNQAPTAKHGERYDSDELHNSYELAQRIKNNQPTWTTMPVGSHPVNATPEGAHDLLAYIVGEWCANKYVASQSSEQASSPEMDLEDLTTDRVVRGYYHRHVYGPWSILFDTHQGRSWTRMHFHPIDAVKSAARHGFRVVEEIETEAK
ncbi:MAG: formylglycine-generating enzyme family protein [Planctomycetes bacterium]|nr:formylglycine-generating enzyme family protein [Planctomycetota bacterium]